MRSGFSTLAVSAMNQTPQNAITSPSNSRALRASSRLSPIGVGKLLDLRLLVVVRQQNRAPLPLQFQNLFADGRGSKHQRRG